MSTFKKILSQAQERLASFYIIYGEEDLLRIEAIDGLRQASIVQGFDQKEQFFVDNSHFDWSKVFDSMQSMGLFAEKKLIEIHIPNGKPGKEGGAALQEILNLSCDDVVVILMLPKLERAQLNTAWFKAWQKQAQIYDAKSITAEQLPKWIQSRLSEYQLQIDANALLLFAEKVEGNLLAAKQEIDKLSLLFPANTVLTLANVQEVIANVARFDIFQLASAWMEGNAAATYRLVAGLEQEGDEPILPLWAVSEDIRTLIKLKAGLSQGTSQKDLIQSLRLWGDKQYAAMAAAKRLSVLRLMDALQSCAVVDRQIKGAEDGRAWATLQKLLMDLSV